MGAFESVSSPESITAIATAIATIIGAIAKWYHSRRNKKPIEIIKDLASEQGKELIGVVKDELEIIKDQIKSKDKSKTAS